MSFDEFENVIAERDARIDQLEDELARTRRNIDFMEDSYLKQHGGSWGRCKYQAAIERGGWDISPCRICNEDVVCLPEGGALCIECAGKQDEQPAVLPERKS